MRDLGFDSCQFREMSGKTESYLVAQIPIEDQHAEIYVYNDETGLMVNKQWFVCERPDFQSDKELIRAFSEMLSEKLTRTSK